MFNKDRRLLILFGSQTGTAQDVAETLWRDAKRRHFRTRIMAMDDYSIAQLVNEPIIVFVCSTTGQGEEPDNMKQFWRFLLHRSLPTNSLSNTKMTVLGLGDSSYQKFNFAAKKLYRRLLQLGAEALCELGMADERHDLGFEGIVEPWSQTLWEVILRMYPFPDGFQVIAESEILPPKFAIRWTDQTNDNSQPIKEEWKPHIAPIFENTRVTGTDHFQDTRLISMDIGNSDLIYSPGDVAMIQPSNLRETVEACVEVLDLHSILDKKFMLDTSDSDIPLPQSWLLPSPVTVRQCFECYFDLQCVPRLSFFKIMASFATDEMEKEKLTEFCSAENQQDLYNYCNRPRRTTVETLTDFPDTSRKIPFDYFFDLFTQIRPRAFSIASCLEVHQNHLQLLVAVVNYKSRLVKPRQGLCSTWLSRLRPGNCVPLWIKKGTFRFPTDKNAPCIFVGPGTGIAPFRSYIHYCKATNYDRKIVLFFGCRNKQKDFYFESEWPSFENVQLITAFSRDQPQKIYVQHEMEKHGQLVSKIISQNGYVFVAGSANQMPKDVEEVLTEIIRKFGNIAISNLEKTGRFQLETWS